MKYLLLMCWEFFKTGLFAVGGGLATLPFLSDIAVRYPQWFTLKQLADMVAVSESTPGPMGINMATYAGFKSHGLPGAVLAPLSLTLPSFVTILIVSKFLEKFKENIYLKSVFEALRPAAIGLVCSPGFSVFCIALFKKTISSGFITFITSIDPKAAVLFAVIMIFTQLKKTKDIHPIAYIAVAAAAGIIFAI